MEGHPLINRRLGHVRGASELFKQLTSPLSFSHLGMSATQGAGPTHLKRHFHEPTNRLCCGHYCPHSDHGNSL